MKQNTQHRTVNSLYIGLFQVLLGAWKEKKGQIPRRLKVISIYLKRGISYDCFPVLRVGPGARFSKVPKSFRTRKAVAKSQTL